MAIIKANYTQKGRAAKASVRYIENRPSKSGTRIPRTLFNADGQVSRGDAYAMIDQAAQGNYFFRVVISPDPQREDSDQNLALRELTEKAIQSLEERLQRPLAWVATIHADHTDHRHIHTLVIVPQRLQVPDFNRMRRAATEEALAQRQQLELTKEVREQSKELGDEVGLSW
jgi:hypothetical protein